MTQIMATKHAWMHSGRRRCFTQLVENERRPPVAFRSKTVPPPVSKTYEAVGLTTDAELVLPSLCTRRNQLKFAAHDLHFTDDFVHLSAQSKMLRLNPVSSGLKDEIIENFNATYSAYERSFELFRNTVGFFEKHEALRHPPIFYVGHTAAFFVNKLILSGHLEERVCPETELQTAVGVDEMSWDDLSTDKYGWPSFDEAIAEPRLATEYLQKVFNFRRDVRIRVMARMELEPMPAVLTQDSFWWIICMGIGHENIHLETSAAAHRQAETHMVQKPAIFSKTAPRRENAKDVPKNEMVTIPGGEASIGRADTHAPRVFGWDNEFGEPVGKHFDELTVSKYLCSNAEFLEFITTGGYRTKKFWDEEGWNWADGRKPLMPRYWMKNDGGQYMLKLLGHQIPMPWDWPVEVNCLEAEAFCRWKGNVRLLDEFEFAHVRNLAKMDIQDTDFAQKWEFGSAGNVNLEQYSTPCPIDANEHHGVYDVLGNVWQHSSTLIDVLPAFKPHPMYEDFTTPTIDGRHTRILGGSFLSCGANGGTRDSRFGFRKHFQQFAGFRYTVGEVQSAVSVVSYTHGAVGQMAEFHFSTTVPKETAPPAVANYPRKLAAIIQKHVAPTVALEVCCGAGATSLALVDAGFDVYASDVNANCFAPTEMFEQVGLLRWGSVRDGDLVSLRELRQERTKKAKWIQIPDYSAMDMRKIPKSKYGLVVMAQPDGFKIEALSKLRESLREDGVLVLGTSYDWSLPGVEGESGPEVLEKIMTKLGFGKSHGETVSFWKGHTERKFQFASQDISVWKLLDKVAFEGPTEAATQVSHISESIGQSMYGNEDVMSKYKEFHFGQDSVEPVFPKACADIVMSACDKLNIARGSALELGGGPGRAALELSRRFDTVLGSDYEVQFVQIAQDVAAKGGCEFNYVEDPCGKKVVQRRYVAPETASKVEFQQINAMDIENIGTFDLVCGFNLIDRLPDPSEFIGTQLPKVTKAGSLVVFSSPYTWVESFTPKYCWLGGYKYGDNDGPSSYEGLKERMLKSGFEEALPPQDQWFAIPDGSNRMFQRTKAHITFWSKL
eukprot:GEMP01005736.1.p1 GENE.GEMP01005736.1~~GEMP01005736.1.p1  ORF type:complete len:1063 (+),score=248.94 GEMP01005736.1:274-3462(+)